MTDDEDEKTPPRQPTPRPYRMTDSEREARRQQVRLGKQWPRGVPVVRPEPADEVTAPIELLLNGTLDEEDYAQIEALRRSDDDLHRFVLNLAKALVRYRSEERSGSQEVQAQVVAAITASQSKLNEIENRLNQLAPRTDVAALRGELASSAALLRTEIGERHTETKGSVHENLSRLLGTHRTARWLAGLALTGALAAVSYVAATIRSSGADANRLDRAERDIESTQQDLRDIRRELRRKEP